MVLSSTETYKWFFSDLDVNVSKCDIDSVRIILQSIRQPGHTQQIMENQQIAIHNSSFGSLFLNPGTQAQISECHIDGQLKPRPTLITAINSDISIQNCHFGSFIGGNNLPTVLRTSNNCHVIIDQSVFAKYEGILLHGSDNSHFTINNSVFVKHNGMLLLQNNGSLNMNNSLVSQNSGPSAGFSAIVLQDEIRADIRNSVFEDNSARNGGALNADNHCRLELVNCTFSRNKAIGSIGSVGSGGAISALRQVKVHITSCMFQDNFAQYLGGAIHGGIDVLIQIEDTNFTRNEASVGGVFGIMNQAKLGIARCLFEDNLAREKGGAIFGDNIALQVQETTFVANNALHGGAMYVQANTQALLTNCKFHNNVAENAGGAIRGQCYVTLELHDTNFTSNKASQGGVFDIIDQANLLITHCVFEDNEAHQRGGAISGQSITLCVGESRFITNTAQYGGAVDAKKSILEINETYFSFNKASVQGAAIQVNISCQLLLRKCQFLNNTAQKLGGAVYGQENSTLKMHETNFTGNQAVQGGAITTKQHGNLLITHCVFQENFAYEIGGAILSASSKIYLHDAKFISNKAQYGGAIVAQKSEVEIKDTYFAHNMASKHGGAIHVKVRSRVLLVTCKFQGNSAQKVGGAIHTFSIATLEVHETYFIENHASHGGAIYTIEQTNILVIHSIFEDNLADQAGGAILVTNITLHMRDTKFISNKAAYGGAIMLKSSELKINGAYFSQNIASSHGGAIYVKIQCQLLLRMSALHGNVAEKLGGAIHSLGNSYLDIHQTNFTGNVALRGGGFSIRQSTNLRVTHCKFENNLAHETGGAIIGVKIILDIKTTKFTSNKAQQGGAITVQNSLLDMNGTHFIQNIGSLYGGAIYVKMCSRVLLTTCNFQENVAQITGGAIRALNISALEMRETNFSLNSASDGGAIDAREQTSLLVTHCEFKSNKADERGGNILGRKIALFVQETTFTNSTARYGGTMMIQNSNVKINETNFSMNTASEYGGAIEVEAQSQLLLNQCKFERNTAQTSGGAIHGLGNVELEIYETNFTGNNASIGGAIGVLDQSSIIVIRCVFEENLADQIGGAIYGRMMILEAQEAIFLSNNAKRGGAIVQNSISETNGMNFPNGISSDQRKAFQGRGYVLLRKCSFNGNVAQNLGGSIHCLGNSILEIHETNFTDSHASIGGAIGVTDQADFNATDCQFEENSADQSGGAIFGRNITVHVQGTNFTRNNAQYGGAILVHNSSLEMSRIYFLQNIASQQGGALEVQLQCQVLLNICSFHDNFAQKAGGAICALMNSTLEMHRIYFTGNRASEGGVIISQNIYLFVSHSVFEGNLADRFGGAIACTNVTLDVKETNFSSNIAQYGGAVMGQNSKLNLSGTYFSQNNASEYGGAIDAQAKCHVLLRICQFQSNIAQRAGGGIRSRVNSTFEIRETDFTGNKASVGGAIGAIDQANLLVIQCRFEDNLAKVRGGAIFAGDITLHVYETVFKSNGAEFGGAMMVYNSITGNFSERNTSQNVEVPRQVILTKCQFQDNVAQADGGAIISLNISELQILETNFTGNNASVGGAISATHQASLLIFNSTFGENSAYRRAGSIFSRNTPLYLHGATFRSNRAPYGGAIGTMNSTLHIRETYFAHNAASEQGGAIDSEMDCLVYLQRCIFQSNNAEKAGGAISIWNNSALEIHETNFTFNKVLQEGAMGEKYMIISLLDPGVLRERGG